MEVAQIPPSSGVAGTEATEVAAPAGELSVGQVAPNAAASPSDAVGFGKPGTEMPRGRCKRSRRGKNWIFGWFMHGGMTYEEAWVNEPQYCMWVMTTFKQQVTEGLEEETPWKEGERMMKRFAQRMRGFAKLMAQPMSTTLKLVEELGTLWNFGHPQSQITFQVWQFSKEMELVEVPASRSLKDRVGQQEKKQKFYGVAKPEKRICTSWEECKQYVHGVKGVVYRSFATREEAEEFVNNPPLGVTKTRKQLGWKVVTLECCGIAQPPTDESNGEAKNSKKTKKNQQILGQRSAGSREDSTGDGAEEPQPPAKKRRSTRTKGTAEVPENSDAKSEKGSNDEDTAPAEVPKGKKKGLLALAKAKAKADAKAKAKVKAKAKAEAKATGKTKSEEKPPQSPAKGEAKASAKAKAKTTKAKAASPKADASPESPAAAAPAAAGISDQVLMAADSCGLRTALLNLASRPEIEALRLDGHCLLHTLKECEGLVNKAKAQLLENGPSTPPKSQNADAQVETPEKVQVPKMPKVPDVRAQEDKHRAMEIDSGEAPQIQAADVSPPVLVPAAPVPTQEVKAAPAAPDGNCCPNCDTPFAESGSFCRCCGMARRKKAPSTGPKVGGIRMSQEMDPEIYNIIEAEKDRQRRCVNLIASENFAPLPVLEAVGSVMVNKYSEGYPGRGSAPAPGTSWCAEKEEWGVNVQSLSGSPANFQVFTALCDVHDRIMGLDLPHGGHGETNGCGETKGCF
eukprot:s658_g39.t1